MDALQMLAAQRSWKLERISKFTAGGDIAVKLSPSLGDPELRALAALIRCGSCFRCRLGRGRWHFGSSPEEAAAAALKKPAK